MSTDARLSFPAKPTQSLFRFLGGINEAMDKDFGVILGEYAINKQTTLNEGHEFYGQLDFVGQYWAMGLPAVNNLLPF